MAYKCNVALGDLAGSTKFSNQWGHQCVALIQGCTTAPSTGTWKAGIKVMAAAAGAIAPGTAIATFDKDGKYPMTQRHAAIYISHDSTGISVYHQYAAGQTPNVVHKYFILNKKLKDRTTMDADYYWVID